MFVIIKNEPKILCLVVVTAILNFKIKFPTVLCKVTYFTLFSLTELYLSYSCISISCGLLINAQDFI